MPDKSCKKRTKRSSRPPPPSNSPPALPRKLENQLSPEYERAQFSYSSCRQFRSRPRERKRSCCPSFQEPAKGDGPVLPPGRHGRAASRDRSASESLTRRHVSLIESLQRRSATEEEVAAILKGHRQKRHDEGTTFATELRSPPTSCQRRKEKVPVNRVPPSDKDACETSSLEGASDVGWHINPAYVKQSEKPRENVLPPSSAEGKSSSVLGGEPKGLVDKGDGLKQAELEATVRDVKQRLEEMDEGLGHLRNAAMHLQGDIDNGFTDECDSSMHGFAKPGEEVDVEAYTEPFGRSQVELGQNYRAEVMVTTSSVPTVRASTENKDDLVVKTKLPKLSKEDAGSGKRINSNLSPRLSQNLDQLTLSQADQKKEEGNQLYKTKNYREALIRYSEAISLSPQSAAFYGNRSACHMMLSQFTQALNDAQSAVRLDNDFVKGYVRVSKCCVALGDTVSAEQAIRKALSLDPNSSIVVQEQSTVTQLKKFQVGAERAIQSKDFRKAVFCLDRALGIAVASTQLKATRAECLAYLGRCAEAQEAANDLIRSDNMNADAIYVRGLCLYYEDNVDKAFSHFQKVLRLAPDHQKAKDIYKKAKQLKLKKEEGNEAFKAGKWVEAHGLYTEALQIDPYNKHTNAKLYFNRATVAAKLKRHEDSVQDCTLALQLVENYFKALLRRAMSYTVLEQYEEAVRDYEQAHRLERGNHEVRQLLQQAKVQLKNSKRKDYYKILGVARGANDDEIKKAYRKRALVHHPDRHSASSEKERKEHEKKFKEVGEAYGVLTDTKKRTRYDNGHDIDDLEGGGHGFGAEMDPNQIFQAFFGGGGGGGLGGGGGQSFSFGGGQSGNFTFQFG